MDTKWIKFKYSSLNKFLCALIAAVLAGIFAINGVTAFRHIIYFGINGVISGKEVGYIDTAEFATSLSSDIGVIIDDVSHNSNQAYYDAAKASTVEKAVNFTQEAIPYIEEYKTQMAEYRQWENGIYNEQNYMEAPTFYLSMAESYGITNVDYQYDYDTFSFELPVQDSVVGNTNSVKFEADGETRSSQDGLSKSYSTQFGDQSYYLFCHNTSDAGESAELGLKNIRYYASYSDGSVATNVEDAEGFVNSVKNGEGEYFVYENGNSYSSERLRQITVYDADFYGDTAKNVRMYISVDPTFSADDSYAQINKNFSGILTENAEAALYIALFALIGCVIFAVISVRLAGNMSDGTVVAAKADRFPLDLGFVLAALSVFGICMLLLMLIDGENVYVFGYDIHGYSNESSTYFALSGDFFSSQWYKNILFALGAAAYLIILGFSVSVARNAKTGVNIFKHTFIYKFGSLIVSFFIWLHKGTKKFFKTIVFTPERLHKKAVWAVALFSLFNIIGTAVAVLLLQTAPYGGGKVLVGLFFMLVIFAVDAYCIYKAFKFMRALDKLIDCSAKNEPVDIDTATLPLCLKTLADALDRKNAQLQEAVIKAVKDERTKAELITNVSHDLKTPLTSVINYIDLLKKCEIKDETAVKYMGVIDEKANRLKRLIEDLIEASKVSTGNVVLNKTKINLNELATQAIVEYTDDFEKSDLELIFDESAAKHIVFADGTKVYRVFENLLSNAKKYSARGSRVYARLYSQNGFGCFEIKNISKEALNISAEELTERFVRGDKSRTQEGNGLGLSIAKELCRLNGGQLVISIDGDLFKATVMLPASNTEESSEK